MHDLLPPPRVARPEPGEFVFSSSAGVSGPFADAVRLALAVLPLGDGPGITVAEKDELGPEAYELTITPERIEILAGDRAGAFYAAQTLRQLLPDDAFRAAALPGVRWAVPCGRVEDSPAHPWRGTHLDVARHFFPKREVLRMIDLMAVHKLNRLHLHLVDDQGWRVESRRHPRLHEIASHRLETVVSHKGEPQEFDGTPHGGFYTLADLSEIAAYARARCVTVVPELDVPGHAAALLAAYPELSARPGAEHAVWTRWGISPDILSPLQPTVAFLAGVIEEWIDALGPTPYFHLGGDECVLDDWAANPEIVAYQRELGLAGPGDLHAHFLLQLADVLSAHGSRAVVWDEAFVSGALRPDSIVMAWRGEGVARRAAEAGYDVVMTPVLPTYFDYSEVEGPDEPLAIAGPLPLSAVASFRPVPAEWSAEAAERVLGTQFQLWSERIPDARTLDYRAWPRGCALAQVAWSGQAADVEERLPRHLRRLDALGVEYRPLDGPRPWQKGGTGRRRHRANDFVTEDVMRHLDELTLAADSTRPS
ncbi:beta-N-acetylhexosaminidase [Bailinhaonella thermotolerans]|uniref:beta-N-acetylhexosaminidase n=1 Tax=Bailinhaonella thermotolerans TaxID=1070861 RepID=A0A3A4AYR1_9ACTN|nr:beta-N-acetylhexosaminidase [Bailinhaonella thermotolerans]RJL30983.1 beta-N-acetylhexosaminidase [Bailinhaonella thermotolerans]